MKPLAYHQPSSIADAVSLLKKNEGAKFLAGGQSLLPVVKLELAQPSDLVSLGRERPGCAVAAPGVGCYGALMSPRERAGSDEATRGLG